MKAIGVSVCVLAVWCQPALSGISIETQAPDKPDRRPGESQGAKPPNDQTSASDSDDRPDELRLVLDLRDGSRIVGVPSIDSLKVQTSFAKFDLELKLIASIKFNEDREGARINLTNGDTVQATLHQEIVQLQTCFGKIAIPFSEVVRLSNRQRSTLDKDEESLLLYYDFDDAGSGKITDRSRSGNTAVVHNAVPLPDRQGRPHRALRFNGSGAWVEVDNKIGQKLTRHVSVCVWLKRAGRGFNWGRIVSGGSPINTVYCMTELEDVEGVLWRPVLNEVGAFALDIHYPCDLSNWTFVVGTYDGEQATLYVNGEKVQSRRCPGTLKTNDGTIAIGGETGPHGGGDTPSWFNGVLDEVRIYERALTEREVRLLYERTK